MIILPPIAFNVNSQERPFGSAILAQHEPGLGQANLISLAKQIPINLSQDLSLFESFQGLQGVKVHGCLLNEPVSKAVHVVYLMS